MTDEEKLKALLTEFGVEFEEAPRQIICLQGRNKIDGYTFFYTTFDFEADGTFLQMGAWE